MYITSNPIAAAANRPQDLTGDLVSAPPSDAQYRIQEVATLEAMLSHTPLHQRATMRDIIRDRIQMCQNELDMIGPATRTTMLQGMGVQFRLRFDFQRMKLACEQWIPALQLWLVNGYYDPTTPARKIIEELKQHDPRREENDPLRQLEDRREAAAAQRKANEEAGDARVAAAIDALGDKGIRQFCEVESALRSGEQITFRGSDAATLQRLQDSTKQAAARGDVEAQQVLTHGVRDTPALVRVPRKRKRHSRQ